MKGCAWVGACCGCETVLRKMGGLLRSAGGCRNALASVEVYDPATGEWSAAAPMATARYSHSCAVLDGRLWVAGGVDW